jgi:phosphopentomutase
VAKRAVVLVLDGVGAGGAPDAAAYGDEGANTLANTARHVGGLRVPELARLGLGNVLELAGVQPTRSPAGSHGLMVERSAAKASLSGHWEIMGLVTTDPLPTYPDGFPAEIVERFSRETGRGVLGNRPASGTQIVEELGPEHERTGNWIVYTSADSVFQVAAHTGHVPLEELYAACRRAHAMLVTERLLVERVIARPFHGSPGAYEREEENRHDYGITPPGDTYLDLVQRAGLETVAVGKVYDIFEGRGMTRYDPGRPDDAAKVDAVLRALREFEEGLVFANLVDFDSLYGHRRDPHGMAANLARFDARIPELLAALGPDGMLVVTSDHGNDPTYSGTDHTRERVPLLVHGGGPGRSLGVRETFADAGATVAAWLGVDGVGLPGRSALG